MRSINSGNRLAFSVENLFPSGEIGTAIAQPRSTNSLPSQNCALAINSLLDPPAIISASGGGAVAPAGSKNSTLIEMSSPSSRVSSAASRKLDVSAKSKLITEALSIVTPKGSFLGIVILFRSIAMNAFRTTEMRQSNSLSR